MVVQSPRDFWAAAGQPGIDGSVLSIAEKAGGLTAHPLLSAMIRTTRKTGITIIHQTFRGVSFMGKFYHGARR